MPERLMDLAEWRGAVTVFTQTSAEHRRIAETDLFGVENSYKAIKGRYQALISPGVWSAKAEREKSLRAKVNGKPALKKQYAGGWEMIARALDQYRPRRKEYQYLENAVGFRSRLYTIARTLVRGTEELQKPNEKRLREYRD